MKERKERDRIKGKIKPDYPRKKKGMKPIKKEKYKAVFAENL
jgi:hypothetical protein